MLAGCTAPQAAMTPQGEPAVAAPPALPEARFDPAELEAHLRILASDAFQGRAPGTPGGDAAARYIAEQFRAAGLRPAPGTDDFMQPVDLVRTQPADGATLEVLGQTLVHGQGMLHLAGPALDAEAEVVLAGFGQPGDYEGLDVEGKIVVTRFGLPDNPGADDAGCRLGSPASPRWIVRSTLKNCARIRILSPRSTNSNGCGFLMMPGMPGGSQRVR